MWWGKSGTKGWRGARGRGRRRDRRNVDEGVEELQGSRGPAAVGAKEDEERSANSFPLPTRYTRLTRVRATSRRPQHPPASSRSPRSPPVYVLAVRLPLFNFPLSRLGKPSNQLRERTGVFWQETKRRVRLLRRSTGPCAVCALSRRLCSCPTSLHALALTPQDPLP